MVTYDSPSVNQCADSINITEGVTEEPITLRLSKKGVIVSLSESKCPVKKQAS
jgi:hypothetical protein